MRKLQRPSVSLPTIRRVQEKYDVTKDKDHGGPPEGKWNNPDVRGALYSMSSRVCAYCQRYATDGRGDVEHFRPKSIYRWLQYDFDNYYISCSMCNRQRKRNKFPIVTGAPRMTQNSQITSKTEKRLLLDPSIDPVEEWIHVKYRDPLCPVEPVQNIDVTGRARSETTIHFFWLNTKKEIRSDRYNNINEALTLLDAATEGNALAKEQLLYKANRYRPHGAAIRQMIAEMAPSIGLPSFTDELKWYVGEILRSIDEGELLLEDESDLFESEKKDIENSLNEDFWSLAVLLKDPPGVPPLNISEWIDEKRLENLRTEYLPKL